MSSKRSRRSSYEDTPANKISKGVSFGVSRGISPGQAGSTGMVSTSVRKGKSIGQAASRGVPTAVRRSNGGPLGYLGVGDPDGMDRLKLSQKRNEQLNVPHYKKGGKPKKHAEGGLESEMGSEEAMMKKKRGGKLWIKDATKNKGALHKSLGVPQGKKIPLSKIHKAEHSNNPTLRKRAQLADTLRGFHNKSSRGR